MASSLPLLPLARALLRAVQRSTPLPPWVNSISASVFPGFQGVLGVQIRRQEGPGAGRQRRRRGQRERQEEDRRFGGLRAVRAAGSFSLLCNLNVILFVDRMHAGALGRFRFTDLPAWSCFRRGRPRHGPPRSARGMLMSCECSGRYHFIIWVLECLRIACWMLHVMRGCLPDLELCLFGHYLWWQMKGFDFAKIMILVGNRESDLYCNVVDHLIGRAIMCLFSTVFFSEKRVSTPAFIENRSHRERHSRIQLLHGSVKPEHPHAIGHPR
jgi:hypothetical protein